MSILQFPQSLVGQNGIAPTRRPMVVTDDLATVLTAGYLNNANLSPFTLAPNDVVWMQYNCNSDGTGGTFGIFTVDITDGVITLSEYVSGSGVTTVGTILENTLAIFQANDGETISSATAGSVAVSVGFQGFASDCLIRFPDPSVAFANVILDNCATTQNISTGNLAILTGNLSAGSSGHAGTVASYPSAAAKGSLILAGVANTGDTNTTISNVAMGQATTVSIPDPANGAARFMIGATATPFVSGNIPVASGTGGLFVDSGFTLANQMLTASVTMSAAQVNAAFTTPVTIVAAPASGLGYVVTSAYIIINSSGHTAFATGGDAIIQYGTFAAGLGTNACAAIIPQATMQAAANTGYTLLGQNGANIVAGTNITTMPICFSNQTANFTAGTGTTVTVTVSYYLIDAP